MLVKLQYQSNIWNQFPIHLGIYVPVEMGRISIQFNSHILY